MACKFNKSDTYTANYPPPVSTLPRAQFRRSAWSFRQIDLGIATRIRGDSAICFSSSTARLADSKYHCKPAQYIPVYTRTALVQSPSHSKYLFNLAAVNNPAVLGQNSLPFVSILLSVSRLSHLKASSSSSSPATRRETPERRLHSIAAPPVLLRLADKQPA